MSVVPRPGPRRVLPRVGPAPRVVSGPLTSLDAVLPVPEPLLTPVLSLVSAAVAAVTTVLGAPPPSPAPDPPTASWTAPLAGPLEVLAPFSPPPEPWLPGHRGVDLDALPGTPVLAAGEGIVTFAGALAGRGVVVVLHPDGRRTTYEPVEALVEIGEDVRGGEVIGVLGSGASHCGGVPSCLHWGLRTDTDYQDPLTLLRVGRPVLLPLAPGGT